MVSVPQVLHVRPTGASICELRLIIPLFVIVDQIPCNSLTVAKSKTVTLYSANVSAFRLRKSMENQ